MQLPMVKDVSYIPSITYQGCAFVLGIIISNEGIREAYYNNYINLSCNNTYEMSDLELSFCDSLWDDYRKKGIAEMNLYQIKNICVLHISSFLKERISQGNYIILYTIDEFYLSHTSNYNKSHFVHDLYLYGYENDYFYAIGYKNGHLSMFKIACFEVEQGIIEYYKKHVDASLCTFKPINSMKIKTSEELIIEQVRVYLKGRKSCTDNKSYGIEIYNNIEKCLINYMERKKQHLDLIPFRVLWEHKKVLLDHYIKINTFRHRPFDLSELYEVENLSRITFYHSIKNNVKTDAEVADKLLKNIHNIKEKEVNYLNRSLFEYGG